MLRDNRGMLIEDIGMLIIIEKFLVENAEMLREN